jgi:nucleoside-diphosphate-sugar epimerase
MVHVVTGASGFLGRRLAELLIERGERVRVLVRPSSLLRPFGGAVEIVRCDFADLTALGAALAGARRIFHCAAHSADWGSWETFRQANVDMVRNLLTAASDAGAIERFVHVSTTDVYGYPKVAGDESIPLTDVGLSYNRTKLLGDRLALELGARHGLPVTVVRPATIFGPHGKDWVVELARLLGYRMVATIEGGRSPAGLVYVDDVAEAMIALSFVPAAAGRAFNVADPVPVTWRSYFDIIAEGAGLPRPRLNFSEPVALRIAAASESTFRALRLQHRPLLTRHLVFLLARDQQYHVGSLSAALGRYPFVGVEEGLERTTAWLRQSLAGSRTAPGPARRHS